MTGKLNSIVTDVKNGKGSLGALLTDSAFIKNLDEAVTKIKSVGDEAESIAAEAGKVVTGIKEDLNNGKGTVYTLLKDSVLAARLNASLENIEHGTEGFNQNMEALKHNFLFRGYFKKLERQKEK